MANAIDRSMALSTEVVLFEKANWDIRGDKMRGIPGTWFFFKGVYLCCPKCRYPSFLHPRVTRINSKGELNPDFLCTNVDKVNGKICNFHRKVILDQWNNGKRIYACAIIRNNKPEIVYTQANSQDEARRELGPCDSITAIAPAIGFFSHDKDDKVVSTDGKLDKHDEKLYAELGIHNVKKRAIKD